jgi:hypothetical protein
MAIVEKELSATVFEDSQAQGADRISVGLLHNAFPS